jgi:hypothetical protein
MRWWQPPLPKIFAVLVAIEARLKAIEAQQILLLTQGLKQMAAIDDIMTDVTAEDTEIGSVITLLQGLTTALATAGVDPTKLAALRADIQSRTQALAAAVVANTPAATPVASSAAKTGP